MVLPLQDCAARNIEGCILCTPLALVCHICEQQMIQGEIQKAQGQHKKEGSRDR
jgi:hypothetical protein